MKILVALTYYYPHWTGLTVLAQRISEGLVTRGHQVTVVTSRYRRDLERDEMHNGVHVVRCPVAFSLSRGQVMPTYLSVLRRLVREHDVVHIHTPMLESWFIGAIAHKAGRKVLMMHHGDLVMPGYGLLNRAVQAIVGHILERAADMADVITMHTADYTENSDYLRPHARKVVTVLPPYVFPRPEMEGMMAWRRQLGLNGHKVVGFAGRFVEEKGFDYLLRAIPLIAEKIPNVRFVFAGEPNVAYESFYEQCLPLIEAQRDRLVMLGLITDRERMAQFYAMCDVFVLPSRTDCMPTVQIEAMLCGTPVVATDIPGARQAVKRTGMGLLVEPRSESALADGLIQALTHRQDYVKSHDHISAIFDPAKSLTDYEGLLESLVAGTVHAAPELSKQA